MKKILVVDDQLAMRNMFKKIFLNCEFDIDFAEDGLIAYRAATKLTYDMIITDYHMPNLNGIELIEKLRKLAAYTDTPMLLVSTIGNTNSKNEAKQAGATGWFPKPITRQELMPVVKQLLTNQG